MSGSVSFQQLSSDACLDPELDMDEQPDGCCIGSSSSGFSRTNPGSGLFAATPSAIRRN
jgi:hypothetical protein